MIQLVIFDMAGTAINEDNLVYKTILTTLSEFDMEVDLPLVLEHCAGKEKWQAIHDLISVISDTPPTIEVVDTIHEKFQLNLRMAYALLDMSVFPSVEEVMATLKKKNLKIAFNTGYSRTVAEEILKKVNVAIGPDIDILMTASDVENSRPAPDMITAICERLDIPPERCVKVGDSAIDIEEGKNASVKYTIGVTTGAQNATQLQIADPDFIIDDMKELLPIIESA